MSVRDIRIADYDYPLPAERIASHPLAERDQCLLLVSDGEQVADRRFAELPQLVTPGALMVCNNTRVINARLHFRRATGAAIEVFLLEPHEPADYNVSFQSRGECSWACLVGNLKRWKEGEILRRELEMPWGETLVLEARRGAPLPGNAHVVTLSWDSERATLADVVDAAGRIPIPPYLCRDTEDSDYADYQTIYSKIKGSVAAPTAGLHFTQDVFQALESRGVERREVTLHVGAGTFQPVKSEIIGEHPMHTEVFSVDLELVRALSQAVRTGRPIVAVGTTSVRTLESLPLLGRALQNGAQPFVGQWDAYSVEDFDTAEALDALASHMEREGRTSFTASTAIMIAPGFRWRLVGSMVTNFHQPQSTLLLLVSSFLGRTAEGRERWRDIYEHALRGEYRFLSYGDACYFTKR